MARIAEPYIVRKRGKSYQFTLSPACGLPARVCLEWKRKSFLALPAQLPYTNLPPKKQSVISPDGAARRRPPSRKSPRRKPKSNP